MLAIASMCRTLDLCHVLLAVKGRMDVLLQGLDRLLLLYPGPAMPYLYYLQARLCPSRLFVPLPLPVLSKTALSRIITGRVPTSIQVHQLHTTDLCSVMRDPTMNVPHSSGVLHHHAILLHVIPTKDRCWTHTVTNLVYENELLIKILS